MHDLRDEADEKLYVLCAEGNPEAFQYLVERYQNLLVGYFMRRAGEAGIAEDLAQEVFIKLWRTAERYTVRARFSTYMYSVAHNTLIDHIRRKGTRADTISADTDEGAFLADTADSGIPEVLEHLAHEEQLALVRKALEQLKDVERDVVMSVFAEGMSYRDTAEVLGIPEGTVKSRLHGALRHMKQILEQGSMP